MHIWPWPGVKQWGRPWWWKLRGGASEGGATGEGGGRGGQGRVGAVGGGMPHVGIIGKRKTGPRQAGRCHKVDPDPDPDPD